MRVWILADVSRAAPGGMRRHMELHAEGLERTGHTATLLFAEDIADNAPRAVPRRAPGLRAYLSLRDRFERERPDIVNVHTQCAPGFIVARSLGQISGKVVVMSYAADETAVSIRSAWDVLRWGRAAVPARLTFPRADGIWCVNRQDLEYYATKYGVDRERLRLFPHAVSDRFYEAARDVPRDGRQILFVGTWIHRKGVDVLAPALERVTERRPDLRVVLAGTLSGESTVRAALSPRLAERVQVLDRANDDELAELYRSSVLLLVPSRREGLPIGMLEAMACGCPPLAAANSGMLDVIRPGENGWLETSFDPERWASRITELLERPDALARASEGATESARAFRVTTVAESVAAWYEMLRQNA